MKIAHGDAERPRDVGRILALEIDPSHELGVRRAHLVEKTQTAAARSAPFRLLAGDVVLDAARVAEQILRARTVMIGHRVPQDSVEPRPGKRRVAEPVGALRGTGIGRLKDVLRVGGAPYADPDQASEARMLTTEPADERARLHRASHRRDGSAGFGWHEHDGPHRQGAQVHAGPQGQPVAVRVVFFLVFSFFMALSSI
jgi:hypothetical protein